MGIHDRDYYRDDSNRWWSASEHRGVIAIIAITVACTIASWVAVETREGEGEVPVLTEAMQFRYSSVVPDGQVWRFATSFLIADRGVIWLIFGMLFFYFFGGEMEVLYGTRRFVTFYLLTGVLANVVKFGAGLAGVGVNTVTYGTSAPMFATLVLFAFHYPHRPIRIWFLLPIPVWLLVSLYLGVRLLGFLGAVSARQSDGLPWLAEPLVGAVLGFLYHRTRGGVFGFADALAGLGRRRSPAGLRLYDEDAAPRPTARPSPPPPPAEPVQQPAGGGVDEHLEAKLDAVLAKVTRHGKGSLTAEENEVLMRAAEVFKRKRR